MKAWRVNELGDPSIVMRLEDVERPAPGPGEVLVEVEAAAINFFDILLCQGTYQEKPPLPFTPGAEVAGTIVATGEGVALAVGQRVIALPPLPRGGFAQLVVAPAANVFPISAGMSAEAAAAFFIVYQTGWFALHRRAHLQEGETVLVHAGAGGVGSAAIQLAVAAGARVIATAGGPEKVEVCRRLGAELAIDYREEDFVDKVKGATGGRGADVIYDPVGGDIFDRSRRCVAFEGRILVIGFAGGRAAEAPTNHVLVKNYAVVGVHWGLYQRLRPHTIVEAHEALLKLYAEGKIDPLIYSTVPFDGIPAALDLVSSRTTWGKLVTRPNG